MSNSNSKPVIAFKVGSCDVAVWENRVQKDGQTVILRSVTITKRYRDRETGEWKDSNTYFPSDLADLRTAAEEAYRRIRMRERTNEASKSEDVPFDPETIIPETE